MLDELTAHGSYVTGNNPWIIDTKEHGIRLKGAWNADNRTLTITVTHSNWYVIHRAVWEKIESLMSHFQDAG